MSQASIYWNLHNYAVIEKLLKKASEFCTDYEVWQLNLGHALFMQENTKFNEAIELYKAIVRKHYDNVRPFFSPTKNFRFNSLILIFVFH